MQVLQRVHAERDAGKVIYPPAHDVFNAFKLTEFDQVKVVILGQDPYHGPNQAHGLSFSVKPGVKPPPSLLNMYKELSTDIADFQIPNHGYLVEWAQQRRVIAQCSVNRTARLGTFSQPVGAGKFSLIKSLKH